MIAVAFAASACAPTGEGLAPLRVGDRVPEYGARSLSGDSVRLDFEILLDPQERIVRRFTTMGVPETFLVDGDGVVRGRWTGRFHPFDEPTLELVEEVVEG